MNLSLSRRRRLGEAAPRLHHRKVLPHGLRAAPSLTVATLHPVVQARLKIGEPNDRYEQEADRVADHVMRVADSEVVGVAPPQLPMENAALSIQRMCSECAAEQERLQRKLIPDATNPLQISPLKKPITAQFSCYNPTAKIQRLCPDCEQQVQRQPVEEEEEEEMVHRKTISPSSPAGQQGQETTQSPIPSIVHEVLHFPGEPLDSNTRTFMESRFGHGFSQVRVHTDAKAAESARDVNAHAYTVGHNVVFGGGRFEPETYVGKHLIAHELTHVIQQSSAGNQVQCEDAAGGCADGLTPIDTGMLAEARVAQHEEVKMNWLPHPEIPRADKGKDRKYVGTLCPREDENRTYGTPDLYHYEKPYFFMAEIKPSNQSNEAEEDYQHYARRINEMVNRFRPRGICPEEPVTARDKVFNSTFLKSDLGNDYDISPFPAPARLVPDRDVNVGNFPEASSNKQLFFRNLTNGGVIYWCEKREPSGGEPAPATGTSPTKEGCPNPLPPHIKVKEINEDSHFCFYVLESKISMDDFNADVTLKQLATDKGCIPSGIGENGEFPMIRCNKER